MLSGALYCAPVPTSLAVLLAASVTRQASHAVQCLQHTARCACHRQRGNTAAETSCQHTKHCQVTYLRQSSSCHCRFSVSTVHRAGQFTRNTLSLKLVLCTNCCKAAGYPKSLVTLFLCLHAETDGHVPSSLFLQLLTMLTSALPSNLAASLMQVSSRLWLTHTAAAACAAG